MGGDQSLGVNLMLRINGCPILRMGKSMDKFISTSPLSNYLSQ